MRKPLALCLSIAACAWGAVPTPKEHLGFTPGDDHKLADYAQVAGYFRKLAASSDRLRLVEFGKSSGGKPMLVAFISTPENLRRLDHHRQVSRRLARGEATEEEARKLAAEGKVIVWIDSGLHASEVAPVQHSFELAFRMLTDEGEEARRIRQNVILMQIPVINPDGLDWVAHWYRQNVGTPYELASLPRLYQKYAGHDNNRDLFMLNLEETRHVTRLLFQEWFPQIVYNQHQSPAFPARIFVPPHAEPLNPNIPASVQEGVTLIGAAMRERFARENKPGVLSYYGYDAWWNGGLRAVPAFHNMHGILTETALHSYATPRDYKLTDLPDRFPNGIPPRSRPSSTRDRGWAGAGAFATPSTTCSPPISPFSTWPPRAVSISCGRRMRSRATISKRARKANRSPTSSRRRSGTARAPSRCCAVCRPPASTCAARAPNSAPARRVIPKEAGCCRRVSLSARTWWT